MSAKKRIAGKLSIALLCLCLFLLFVVVMSLFSGWRNPNPGWVLSNMERRAPEVAQEMMDRYSEDLKAIAAAAEGIEDGERCFYKLNYIADSASADWYENELSKMPQELLDALRAMEEEFPESKESLELRRGQVGVHLNVGIYGFSLLCYPGGELISHSVIEDERGTRCLDMGDGWELQMYYAPGG